MTADLYRQRGWLALTSQMVANATLVAASVAPYPAQQQLDADRIAPIEGR
jgi:predicted cation transporter